VNEYLDHLNEAQKAAVVNTDGPALVIAGAGSGKTRVLTYRITHLLRKGVKPWTVLALTFTNKAAKEMKARIADIIGQEDARSLWMGTFHSIFAKILRTEAKAIGYPSNFTIYDSVDTKSILKAIIKEMKLDDQTYKPSAVYSRISGAKNNLISPEAYEGNSQARMNDSKSKRPEIYKIYKVYQDRCFRLGAMDFDDLLFKTNILFRDHPDILAKYQAKFNYVMVDEYQDTNFSQYLIVKKLVETHKNLCVVGDDAQSIYSFRGAKIENILNFQKDYKNYRLFKLEQNYRSTQNIVDAANSIIAKNKEQLQKNVFSENESGEKIGVLEALTDREESYLVIGKIFDSIYTEHTEYKDHAILYRTNAQSRVFEEALRKRNIPYKIYGGTSFYQRKEIKDLLAYFKLSVNKQDDEALKRIINYPKRGIGKTTMDNIELYAREADISMWEVIMQLPTLNIKVNSRAVNQIMGFAQQIDDFTSRIPLTDAYVMAQEIASKSGILQELYKDKAPEGVARHENVQELLNGLKEFSENQIEEGEELPLLSTFLQDVALLTNADGEGEEDNNRVSLMTIHASKGLEYRNVYIVGVEERLFPSEMAAFSVKELEEERRLFYVAVTRAEKTLYISHAKSRYRWGKLYDCIPSRFIRDIDPKFIDITYSQDEPEEDFATIPNKKSAFGKNYNTTVTKGNYNKPTMAKKTTSKKKINLFDPTPLNEKLKKVTEESLENAVETVDSSEIVAGITVRHARFGTGKVVSVEGEAPNTKATIDFTQAGEKTLLLKFAKLEIVPRR